MMRSDTLNWHDYGGYMKMTAPSLNVNYTDEDESKRSIVHDTLSRNFSTDESESKRNIVNKKLSQSCSTNENKSKHTILNEPLSQNCSAEENKLCSTKEDKSYCSSKKKKDAKNEVTYDAMNYSNGFNIFECGIYVLDRLGVSYERACIEIQSTIRNSAYFGYK